MNDWLCGYLWGISIGCWWAWYAWDVPAIHAISAAGGGWAVSLVVWFLHRRERGKVS